MNYNPDMNDADKSAEILLLVVPTGDAACPLTVEVGHWDVVDEEWTGEWRHTETPAGAPTPLAKNDPIAWAEVPGIDDELYEHAALNPNEAAA